MKSQIYIIKVDCPIDAEQVRFLMHFVSPEKQQRIMRQRIKQNADTMLVGAVLAHLAIRKVFHIPLEKQRIACGTYGKPYLQDYPNVHFNISHSGEYVACAVCNHPIGIDIQVVEAYQPDVAKRVCSQNELRKIESSADPAAEFITLWTQKEAYLKMLGCGLSGLSLAIDLAGADIQTAAYGDAAVSTCTACSR